MVRSGSKHMLLALDLLPNYQSSLALLYEKYFNDEEQLAIIRRIFNDHTMQALRHKEPNRLNQPRKCPFKNHLQNHDSFQQNQQESVESDHLAPVEELQKMKTHLQSHDDSESVSDIIQPSPRLVHVSNDNDNETEDTSTIFPKLVIERGLTLKSLTGKYDRAHNQHNKGRDQNQSIRKAQSGIKYRDQNQMIGDSFAHFLELYLEHIWSVHKSNPGAKDTFDELVVENFIKYLKVLHSEYLCGTYKDPNMASLDSSEDLNAADMNEDNSISMDEYRIFVEYTCYLLEVKVMREYVNFKESDLILIESLKYHLTKLSLYFLGELPLSALVKDTSKNSALRRMYTISKSFIPKFLRRASERVATAARSKRMAMRDSRV